MRYIIFGVVLVVIVAGGYLAYTFITTKNHSPADTMVFQDGGFLLTIDYSRPYKKGRLIFGDISEEPLLPYGQYWRTGANEATEIDFNSDVSIEGKTIEAGRYRMYTFPGKETWQVVLNGELDKWGYAEPDYSLDKLRVSVSPVEADSVCEQFLIVAQPIQDSLVQVNLCWDRTIVPIQIAY